MWSFDVFVVSNKLWKKPLKNQPRYLLFKTSRPLWLIWINFNPEWIRYHMSRKEWDEIIYPFPKFNGAIIYNYLSMSGKQLLHVCKRDPDRTCVMIVMSEYVDFFAVVIDSSFSNCEVFLYNIWVPNVLNIRNSISTSHTCRTICYWGYVRGFDRKLYQICSNILQCPLYHTYLETR